MGSKWLLLGALFRTSGGGVLSGLILVLGFSYSTLDVCSWFMLLNIGICLATKTSVTVQ